MAVKELPDGRFLCEIDRAGVKRVRKKFPTQAQAEAFEREYLAQLVPKVAAEDKRKLSELIELWSRYHGVNLVDHDFRRRQLDHICRGLGNPIAAHLTAEMWVDFRYRRMSVAGDNISAKTANNHHQYLNAIYTKLRKLRVIDYESPLAGVDLVRIQERQLTYLNRDQIALLLDCCVEALNPHAYWVAEICLRTGARWGEAEKLKRKQFHNGRITFEFTKSGKTRTVPLDPAFFARLMAEFDPHGGLSPEARLFGSCYGAFVKALKRAKLELPAGQCSHVLRHSFASHFIMGGGNLLTLQKILGHSDIKMTMRYAHLAPEHLADAIRLNPLA